MTLRKAAVAAAEAWGYATPMDSFDETFERRILRSILDEIEQGVADGEVVISGFRFSIPRLGPTKGPYAFFSKDRIAGSPSPNWEYFVQLAEYLRVRRSVGREFDVGFEDGLMDVSVRLEGTLVWYIEAKEREAQGMRLLTNLQRHAAAVDSTAPDRGNDALRKAKYLVKHRPAFFSVIASDWRKDFAVRYSRTDAFNLMPREKAPIAVELFRPELKIK